MSKSNLDPVVVEIASGIDGDNIEISDQKALLDTGALQKAIFNSANFSSIATDAKGVIQIFNVGAERMLGYTAAEVMNKITPADISDPQEVIARAEVLSAELGTPITPGFEALVFKASRGIEDIYELTYIRKDGSRFPAVVSVTALRDEYEAIILNVTDTGNGLSPDQLAQLFQPFNRIGQETSGVEGSGIGLVVSRQLVEMMGGGIGANSTEGVGSEFWIELIQDDRSRIADEKSRPEIVELQAIEPSQDYSLLYVEDSPANQLLVEHIISGYPSLRMLSAHDGSLGVALARAHLPAVILMDINLPGMSGIEAVHILRSDPATAHIPVIAITANAMPQDIEQGLEVGFFRYITKPININLLMNALDDALKSIK